MEDGRAAPAADSRHPLPRRVRAAHLDDAEARARCHRSPSAFLAPLIWDTQMTNDAARAAPLLTQHLRSFRRTALRRVQAPMI